MTSATNTTPRLLQRSGLEACLWAWRAPAEAYPGQLVDWKSEAFSVSKRSDLQGTSAYFARHHGPWDALPL